MGLQRDLTCKVHAITHIIIDVDGTLTDGSICYDATSNELKTFCTRDGAGLLAAKHLGLKLIILTGRESIAVQRRAQDFKVDILEQGVQNKSKWLLEFMAINCLKSENFAYIGDDLNDYAAMQLSGFVACPKDACPEVRDLAHFVAERKGGQGAVRDVLEFLLSLRGEWDGAVKSVYSITKWHSLRF